MLSFILILFQVPGVTKSIPGLNFEYMPTEGMEAVVALHDKMNKYAWIIFGLSFVIGGVIHAIKISTGDERLSIGGLAVSVLLPLVLLVGMDFTFGSILKLGNSLAEEISSKEDINRLNERFEKAAQEADKGTNADSEDWLFQVLVFLQLAINKTEVLVIQFLMVIASVSFTLSSILINLIWRALVIILYVFGPLLIALGPIPGIGETVVPNWIGSTIQISAWQVWIATWAFFVSNANKIFKLKYLGDDKNLAANSYEAVGIAFVCSVLLLLGPVIINTLIPLSGFSALGSALYKRTFDPIKNAVK